MIPWQKPVVHKLEVLYKLYKKVSFSVNKGVASYGNSSPCSLAQSQQEMLDIL
jgi:hypothetical protein